MMTKHKFNAVIVLALDHPELAAPFGGGGPR